MSISAKELAARLQLSAATVSMVFNNKPGISEETRYRVMTAARQYGYVFRNKAPEAPAENRPVQFIIFKNHGSVVGDTSFFTELMEGIVQSCADIGYLAKVSYHYADADFDTQADRNGYRGSTYAAHSLVYSSAVVAAGDNAFCLVLYARLVRFAARKLIKLSVVYR